MNCNIKKTVVYIVSDVDKALAFEWVATHLSYKYDLSFILLCKKDTQLEKYLVDCGIRCYVISDNSHPGLVRKWLRLLSVLRKLRGDVVHTHLWRANILGLTAAWLLRINKRILTRHHAMVHYDQYPSGRKWDRLCNFMATDIIAPSLNTFTILQRLDKAPIAKLHLVHHGFDLAYFRNVELARVDDLRKKYGIKDSAHPIVGVVARYVKMKGVQYIIPAFHELLKLWPEAHLILANAHGDFDKEIANQLKLLPAASYTEIVYEEDLAALYRLFDVYVHVPISQQSEAFGQTYVEALASGIPAVFTLSGVALEFIEDGRNGLVVPYEDSHSIYTAVHRIITDKTLAQELVHGGNKSLASFPLSVMIDKLLTIYG